MKINYKSMSKLLYFEICYVLFYSGIIDLLKLPTFLTYGIDVLNLIVCLYFFCCRKVNKDITRYQLKTIEYSSLILLLFCVFTAAINITKPQLFVWALRNCFRYYPFFFLLIVTWNDIRLEKFVNLLLLLQIPNFIIACIQFFFYGLNGDNIGGLFGSVKGCNAFVNLYLCLCIALSIELYLHKRIKISIIITTIFSWFIIASFTELKIAFIEIPLIVAISVLVNKPSFKTFIVVASLFMALIIGLNLIKKYYPTWAYAFENLSELIKHGTDIGGGYYISRTNVFADINRLIFKNNILLNLVGYGFGNCEYSSFGFLTSDFYNQYGFLNYRWFSHQMWFLQTGYIGIILYALFYVQAGVWIVKQKILFKDEKGYGSFGLIFIVFIFVNFIYNASMTTEIGYLAFAALAIPFIHYVNIRKTER